MNSARALLVTSVSLSLVLAAACKPSNRESEGSRAKSEDSKQTAKTNRRKRAKSHRQPPTQDHAANIDRRDPTDDAHDAKMNSGPIPTVTAADYEPKMLALAGCSIEGAKVSHGCPAARELAKLRRASQLEPAVPTLAAKHLQHKAEAVRLHAASLMRGALGDSEENIAAALAVAKTEKSPAVLAQLVRVLSSKQQFNPAASALLAQLAGHANELVRREVARSFVSPFAVGVEGTLEKAMKMIESDRDLELRVETCRNLGRRVDERALPLQRN